MTIDEAIEQEKFKARVDRIKANKRIFHNNDEDEISACNRSAEKHEQLAEWQEELKEARNCMEENRKSGYNHGFKDGFNKAIDDCKEITFREVVYCDSLNDRTEFRELAEQLKTGGQNEQQYGYFNFKFYYNAIIV